MASPNPVKRRESEPDPVKDYFLPELGKPNDPDTALLKLASTNIDADAFYDFFNHQMFFEPGIGHRTYAVPIEEGDEWILEAIRQSFESDWSIVNYYARNWDEFLRRRIQYFMLQVGRLIEECALSQRTAEQTLWRETQFTVFSSSLVQHLSPAILMLDEASLERFRVHVLDPVLREAATHRVYFEAGGHSIELPPYLWQLSGGYANWYLVVPKYAVIHASHLELLEDPSTNQYIYEWMKGYPPSAAAGGNVPFPPNTVNFGVRTTYRQQWQHRGNQYGDIVRTIPLGPRQVEKISLRVLRRNKVTQNLETSKIEESSEETMASVKDSNEIVNEAAKTSKWGITQKGQGGFHIPAWDAGGSTEFNHGEETRESSKVTKSRVTEDMQKTANKVRRETKVSISLEREETFESTRASEIMNPNDEVAITYVYQRLLKQYRIITYLAEVTPVVFVAENVPKKVTMDWIRRNVDAIESGLLDESLREFVISLKQGEVPVRTAPDSATEEKDMQEKLGGLMDNTTTAMGKLADVDGGVQNIFDSSIQAFTSELGNLRERQRQVARYLALSGRLLVHVSRNLLHYCRTIWESEDSDHRMSRYRRILVPGDFRFETDEASFPTEGMAVTGDWHPGREVVPLSEIINPAGPIGFTGNYALYYLATTFRTRGYVPMYEYYKSFYAGLPNSNLEKEKEGSVDPSEVGVRVSFPKPFLVTYGRYRLKITTGAVPPIAVWRVFPNGDEQMVSVDPDPIWERLTEEERRSGDFDEYKQIYSVGDDAFWVAVDNDVNGGFILDVWPPDLRDPEVVEMEARYPLPPLGDTEEEMLQLSDLFSDNFVRDMIEHLPGLLDLFSPTRELPDKDIWIIAKIAQRKTLYSFYHEYRLRKEHTREIVVDTNNVVLNLHTGTGSAMEPFKRVHRYVDATKVVSEAKKIDAEANQAAAEAERRVQRVADKDLTDPDTERTIVIKETGSDEQL